MMRVSLLALLLFATFAAAQSKPPVLVELFTSEGCSSCPPADRLLIHLEKDNPIDNAEVIVLGEHVDYWDQLGWRDRFSSVHFTNRQQAYALRFHNEGAYTPQMVVNGSTEFVGNDPDRAYDAIKRAAATATAPASIKLQRNGDRLHVVIENAGKRSLDVFCAITEGNLSTHVGDGENRGRDLQHTAVARELRRVGTTRDGRFESDVPLKLASDWRPENLRAVVFLQSGGTGPVTSAAQIPLGPAK